jgi:hypothetical protein
MSEIGPERRSADVRDRDCWDQPQRVEVHPAVAAMTYPDVSHLQVIGGLLMFAGLFVLREITSGALKEAGKDLWVWARDRGSGRDRHGRCEGQLAADRARARLRFWYARR